MQTTKLTEPKEPNCLQRINHLPLELLSYIFILCDEGVDKEANTRTIQFIAPVVCRHWRKIALGTLTTRIRITKPMPCKRTALYLKRAGSAAPLDIEIAIMTPSSSEECQKLDVYAKRLLKTLVFILEHGCSLPRWKFLVFATNVFVSYCVMINFLSIVHLPSLRRLDFLFFGPSQFLPDDAKMFFEAYQGNLKSGPQYVFATPPPQLRSVRLKGVMNRHLFGISQLQLAGLTNIDIIFDVFHPGINHIYSMLAASPRLIMLKFDSRDVEPEEDILTMTTNTLLSSRITLSYLRSLTLMHMQNPAWDLSVLQVFNAPALQRLELGFCDNSDASQLLVEYISNQLTGSSPHFPVTLNQVLFYTAMGETPNLEPLLRAYPNITTLRIGTPTVLLKRPWFVPNLTNLEIETQDALELKDLVLGRCGDGLPLETVKVTWLGDGSTLSEDDKEQIRSMVKLTVSAEEELEDEEEDEGSQDEIE